MALPLVSPEEWCVIHLTTRALEWLAGTKNYTTDVGTPACGAVRAKRFNWCRAEDVRAMVKKWEHAYLLNARGEMTTRKEVIHPTCPTCAVLLDEALVKTLQGPTEVADEKSDAANPA